MNESIKEIYSLLKGINTDELTDDERIQLTDVLSNTVDSIEVISNINELGEKASNSRKAIFNKNLNSTLKNALKAMELENSKNLKSENNNQLRKQKPTIYGDE
ncbi:hypothetical protein [Photobacterium kishitanii]|uniref:Uncharacterized protein n=1 Tax=Photobacterium kishitanii TaxID=318456 RepID=A0A2T3KN11_9GAMM|nr:hypothetical protein [Photobacterium kishitanii]PSV01193.1 hypothetical protein C9J27_03985 [Photobacterium kishitanii]